MTATRTPIVVLGAGPAGLGAALRLARRGPFAVTVLERQAAVGRVVGQLGHLEERQGRNAEADAHYRRALVIVDKLPPRFRNATGKCVQHYLRFLRANNRSQEAAAIEARLTR